VSGRVKREKVKAVGWIEPRAQRVEQAIRSGVWGVTEKGGPDAPVGLGWSLYWPFPGAVGCVVWGLKHQRRDLVTPTICDVRPKENLMGKVAMINGQCDLRAY